jgi:uncharacterized protein (TIGR03435 family)
MIQSIVRATFAFVVFVPVVLPQAPTAPASRTEFEVVSIKLNTSARVGGNISMPGGAVKVDSLSLRYLVMFAYNVKDFQISGSPAWANSDKYDVMAKAAGRPTFEEIRPMLQSLLADRFNLTVHRETKEAPVYDLTAAKGGLKIAPSKDGSCVVPSAENLPKPGAPRPNYCGNIGVRPNSIEAYAVPMERFVATLSDVLGRRVIDKTGIKQNIDVHLEFAPDEGTANGLLGRTGDIGSPAPSTDPPGPSIFTALQEQLGLKLESSKGPVEMLIIDRVERPSEN